MSKRVTCSVAWLKRHKACPEQVRTVREVFGPREFAVTAARLRKAAKLGLYVEWWFLTAFPEREAAYNKACAPALAAYNKACATALAAYNEACATALAAYNEACATAWKAYEEARAEVIIRLLGLDGRKR